MSWIGVAVVLYYKDTVLCIYWNTLCNTTWMCSLLRSCHITKKCITQCVITEAGETIKYLLNSQTQSRSLSPDRCFPE
uniref:Uncharacterized protein n=1 Tax=Gadus morhua TaxID=8049 RepID=A0A8C5B0T3_GADMO